MSKVHLKILVANMIWMNSLTQSLIEQFIKEQATNNVMDENGVVGILAKSYLGVRSEVTQLFSHSCNFCVACIRSLS